MWLLNVQSSMYKGLIHDFVIIRKTIVVSAVVFATVKVCLALFVCVCHMSHQ